MANREKGSVENAVGFLRRNLLVPVPSVASAGEPDARLRVGCERIDPASRDGSGEPTTRTFPADFAAMMSLPGVRFDSVRWLGARSDKRGYARAGGNSYCAGPAWHDRDLVVGVRANSVDILADRNRRVATLPRCWGGEGELAGNPLSLVPAIVARPRATVEPAIRREMPEDLVAAIDAAAGRRRAGPRGPPGVPPRPLGSGLPARRRGGPSVAGACPTARPATCSPGASRPASATGAAST